MECLSALLLTASFQPHDMRAHHLGSAGAYALLSCLPAPRRKIRKLELQLDPAQKLCMGLLFGIGSAAQTPAHPLTMLFLPLFLGHFSDFPLCIFAGCFAAFASENPLILLNTLSVGTLSLFGAHDQRICLGVGCLLHLVCVPFTEGYAGIPFGAYAAFARCLFLRSAPLHLRGLKLLAPLSLLDLFFAERIQIIYLPCLLFLCLFKPGRDALPFASIPIACALTYARRGGLLD